MKHHKVSRTELTPVSFLVRSAYVFPDKTAVVHGTRRGALDVAQRLGGLGDGAADGITPQNTLFVFSPDEGDHQAGPVSVRPSDRS